MALASSVASKSFDPESHFERGRTRLASGLGRLGHRDRNRPLPSRSLRRLYSSTRARRNIRIGVSYSCARRPSGLAEKRLRDCRPLACMTALLPAPAQRLACSPTSDRLQSQQTAPGPLPSLRRSRRPERLLGDACLTTHLSRLHPRLRLLQNRDDLLFAVALAFHPCLLLSPTRLSS